ncbi:hypothetical protein BD311DRAFT_772438 [Dichomitus squalens]|uniref:Uncharacterized protein n=1 Tax=Dichomitus squalens TaxID=114155 RepID=A0A4Q9M6C5_9APHY|nr:hypothetical protein BD311DRAFT_772438 [Dichomitus squalens]
MVVVERLAVKNMTRSLARRGRWRVTRGNGRGYESVSIERWGLYIQIWVYIRFTGAITVLRFGKTRARYE